MTYRFSDRIASLTPSAIREILKVTQNPGVISFAAGNPAPDTFPVADMARIAANIFKHSPAQALQYGVSEGYAPLRESTAARIRSKYGIGGPDDDLIIVSGGQQGMELATKILVNEGETILCEAPSFIGSLNAFRSYRANLVGIPMEPDGMDLDALEHALKTQPNVRLIYTIPTFQNPTGRTASLEKRKQILALAAQYDVLIIEDNPYFELRYSGEDVPTLKSLDTEGRVIYVGSYSKILAPGIRMGYVCANRTLVSKMVVAKQVSDVHTNLLFQMIGDEILRHGDIDTHIANACALYRAKRDRMLDAMDIHLAGLLSYERPDGGIFIWCELPDGGDGAALCRIAGEKGVACVPGAAFMVNEGACAPSLRLNFSLPSDEQIDRGIALLGEAARTYINH